MPAVHVKKKTAFFFILTALLFLAGTAFWGRMQRQHFTEKNRRYKADLLQDAEELLAEHEALFDHVADVLTRQESPLSIDWHQEPWEEEGAFLVHMEEGNVSPDVLEDGFSETVAELYDLVPSSIWYRRADSALIEMTYANENLGVDSAVFYVVSIEYDGTEWSVRTAEYPGV